MTIYHYTLLVALGFIEVGLLVYQSYSEYKKNQKIKEQQESKDRFEHIIAQTKLY